MEVHRLEREFVYNGVTLSDTIPTMTPEQVRETYTHLYPERATAAIEGPETVGGKLVYKLFVRLVRRGDVSELVATLLAREMLMPTRGARKR